MTLSTLIEDDVDDHPLSDVLDAIDVLDGFKNHEDQLVYLMNQTEENEEEQRFINIIASILYNSNVYIRKTRNAIVRSLFSPPELRFSLELNRFPLMTCRKLPFRSIVEELLWMIRGQTDVSVLQSKGVHVWNANSTREFLDSTDRHHIATNHLGRSYGYQFRRFGGWYDQLQNAIHLIRTDPYSRRILINLWNPCDLMDSALPPCLFCFQFYVGNDGTLSCKATQRSSDIVLAGGWNIATIALLTVMIAHVCDLVPKEIVWSVGDAHIYKNQIEVAQLLCVGVKPVAFPTLEIVRSPPHMDITQFEYDCFALKHYTPAQSARVPMNP